MVAHAAALSATGTRANTHVVVLSATLAHLHKLKTKLSLAKVPHVAFHEPDLPWDGELMSIGVYPVENRRMVQRFLKGIKLLGE